MSTKGKKTENIMQNIKESQTLDKKHKEIIKTFQNERNNMGNITQEISNLNDKINEMEFIRAKFTLDELKIRARLLNDKEDLENKKKEITENFNEMDYYDKTGDLIIQYYELRNETKTQINETKNILDFLGGKKIEKLEGDINKAELFDNYLKRIEGTRINIDDGTKDGGDSPISRVNQHKVKTKIYLKTCYSIPMLNHVVIIRKLYVLLVLYPYL
jgi:hypothetical protein